MEDKRDRKDRKDRDVQSEVKAEERVMEEVIIEELIVEEVFEPAAEAGPAQAAAEPAPACKEPKKTGCCRGFMKKRGMGIGIAVLVVLLVANVAIFGKHKHFDRGHHRNDCRQVEQQCSYEKEYCKGSGKGYAKGPGKGYGKGPGKGYCMGFESGDPEAGGITTLPGVLPYAGGCASCDKASRPAK